ncbi:prepilin-type N-terminal cleavage/methylation domain-containing protein [Rhodopirellula sp. MGV]|uniref:prepilin-type N-terminal cleavage/methylation domain-containing protein n=1 Tax=Rhodopirellula sp. MGV TaxID=2023130 RepID=UPI000B96F4C9|nr:prepilin-type N-terminal cleavage/methylation domain-containing protein [Rhodopirellula sp. MGV]OYP32179.1 hypothetical protein CGZ80_20500 [Rhodopirellula sp. MGV]PNY35187.1 hypothetical protein C2E31_20040 [Rhodopirellula baltica]
MRKRHLGFTIIEVLIALAAALLLMLGLTKAYSLLGNRITQRQAQLDLSSRLRDVAVRLRNELELATCRMKPPARAADGEGYFVYHEGPFTSATTALGSTSNPPPRDPEFFRDSFVGDIDDYLAFTTRAKKGSPFVGFIPRGVLEAHRFASNPPGYVRTGVNHRQATELVPFYSEVAEIAYWLSPRYRRDTDGTLTYNSDTASTGQPNMIDRNEDLLPDRMDLHRRVLLVRPDLNMTPNEMFTANVVSGSGVNFTLEASVADVPTIPFLTRNSNGDVLIVPLTQLAGNFSFYPSFSANAPVSGNGNIIAPGNWWDTTDTNAGNYDSPAWLTGLARVQQVMDLSIRRVTNDWSTAAGSRTTAMAGANHFGMPSAIIAANSLGELTRPENRFGFVRIPAPIYSGLPGSSMAQLALCPPHRYLINHFTSTPMPPTGVTATDYFNGPPWPVTYPAQADDARLDGTTTTANFENPFGKFTLSTFLRPEFALADRIADHRAWVSAAPILPTTSLPRASINRGGSDIVATDVVGFDVRAFDPYAPQMVWEGLDQQPGIAGDDDGDGASPDAARPATSGVIEVDELGAPGSDDEVANVDSFRIAEALVDNGTRLVDGSYDFGANARSRFGVVSRGNFVDLNYLRLAGGPMQGLIQFSTGNTAALSLDNLGQFESPFSGVQIRTPMPAFVPFPDTWQSSGRFILNSSGAAVISSFYQPVYDTWTDSYSSDLFDQEGFVGIGSFTQEPLNAGGAIAGAFTERRVPQMNVSQQPSTANMASSSNVLASRRWTTQSSSVLRTGDFDAVAEGRHTLSPTSSHPFDLDPPISVPLRAIQVTIRLNDFSAETIRQQTVIQEF